MPPLNLASSLFTQFACALDAVGVKVAVYGHDGLLHFVHTAGAETTDALRGDLLDLARTAAASEDTPYAVRAAGGTTAAIALGSGVVLVVVNAGTTHLSAASLRDDFNLTRRESEVAVLLAQRRTNREVAIALGISVHTARHHAERVFRKLGVKTKGAAAAVLTGPR